MDNIISDELWNQLLDSSPGLQQDDRHRIDLAIERFRNRILNTTLSNETKEQLETVRDRSARIPNLVERLFKNPEFQHAGVSEHQPSPDLDLGAKVIAAIKQLIEELDRTELRFRAVVKDNGKALEQLLSQLLCLYCERKNVEPPNSWSETAGGLRFHRFLQLCAEHACGRQLSPMEFNAVGQRVTKEVHEYGSVWMDLVGADIIAESVATWHRDLSSKT